MANASKVMSQIKRFLEKKEIGYSTDDEQMLWGTVAGLDAQWQWIISLYGPAGEIVCLRAVCPVNVPRKRRVAAAEYLMRLNSVLNFGNFDLDWSNGQSNFRAGILTTSSGISAKAVKDLFYGPCEMMNRYLPGLLAVALGNEDPAKAVADADEAWNSPAQDEVSPEESTKPEARGDVTDDPADDTAKERTTRLDWLFGSEN